MSSSKSIEPKILVAVVTVSDSCYEDHRKDRSGPRLMNLLLHNYNNCEVLRSILPDETEMIRDRLRIMVHETKLRLILTTGGTGFAERDVTPEATRSVIDKECPQLAMAIALKSLEKTKYAVLSRGVCGIAGKTLIINLPGSEKACVECFEAIRDVLPHALNLISDNTLLVRLEHESIQHPQRVHDCASRQPRVVISNHPVSRSGCGDGKNAERKSPYPMVEVKSAIDIIFNVVHQNKVMLDITEQLSPVDIPPFRASIKDGYAMKSTGFSGTKKVIGCISAGDQVNMTDLAEDECFKINTGAALPHYADCVIQIEDTKLLKKNKHGAEELVEIIIEPIKNLDIRAVGSDLARGSKLFNIADHSPVAVKSILASVGVTVPSSKPKIAIVSTGNELLAPNERPKAGKIYDSNTTMLEELLTYFGFECHRKIVLGDDMDTVYSITKQLFEIVDFVICTGGVSMGDRDFIKPVLDKLNFTIHFGRVNMKPGKPTTFASKEKKCFFGLPGNPVSAFVSFHLFTLPALRWASGVDRNKCCMPTIKVTMVNDLIPLDARPEYARAVITNKNGQFFAKITGDQISSRLQSIVGADVLIHLPAKTDSKMTTFTSDIFNASVLRYDFITYNES